jgi:hypothetical protein
VFPVLMSRNCWRLHFSVFCAPIFVNPYLLACWWKLLPWRHADNGEQLTGQEVAVLLMIRLGNRVWNQ